MPEVITREAAPAAEPMVYKLAQRESWTLLAASCIYDGTGLNSTFVPSLAIYAQNNDRIIVCGLDLLVVQHGSPQVSFAPHLHAPATTAALTNSVLQTGLPQLDFTPGMLLAFGGFAPGSGPSDPAIQLYSMVLYVEGTHAGAGLGNVGPFMLVPGPGA